MNMISVRQPAGGGVVLSESDLRRMFPRGRDEYIKALIDGAPILARHGITANAQRWCAFIANVATETGGLTVVRENMAYTAANLLAVWPNRYPNTIAGRAKARSHAAKGAKFIANYNYGFRLGNRGRNTDDGWNFRGALLLQATGRTMALWLEERTGRPYASVPETFNTIDAGAVEIAALTWCEQALGNLNDWADRGAFRACCNGINRGNPRSSRNPIGWSDRQAAHKRALGLWGAGAGEPRGDTDPSATHETVHVIEEGARGWEVEKYQERLASLGYHVGDIDGDFGDNTDTALRNFQKVNGLEPDGKIGPKTRAVLVSEHALPKPVADARAETTAEDLARAGSRTVQVSLWGRLTAWMTGVGGVSMAGAETFKAFNETAERVKSVAEPAMQHAKWLAAWWPLAVIVVAIVAWQAFDRIIAARVADHRAGKHIGR